MTILHINTFDHGGAATAIIRIHLALLEKGVDSRILFLKSSRDIPFSDSFQRWLQGKKRSLFNRVVTRIKRHTDPVEKGKLRLKGQLSKVEVFSFPTSVYDVTEHPFYKDADIVQLNWVSGFLDEPSFFKKNKKPVVWRMADLYACGGGNHYVTGFPFAEFRDELKVNYALRKKILTGQNITMVPISNWVKDQAEKSELIREFPTHVIHNGLKRESFRVFPQQFAREVFSLPRDGKIILFGADRIQNKRKGFNLLLESLIHINLNHVNLCVFGSVKDTLPDNIINVGRIEDERLLSLLYSAADIFVMSSVEEAFGQVIIEALTCGLPVVSFPTGGSLDVIEQGVNGVVARDFTSVSLGQAVAAALSTPFNREMIATAALERFDISLKADEYICLYKKLLNVVN